MNLQDLMREATSDVEARAGFVDATVNGGRRRARNRRGFIGAGAILTVAGLAIFGTTSDLGSRAVTFAVGGEQPRPLSSPISNTQGGPLSDGRTHGDLANDEAYLAAVRLTWKAYQGDTKYARRIGEPRILWAGSTPAGPAALLAQLVEQPHALGAFKAGTYASLGFIGTSPDGPRVAHWHISEDDRTSTAWYVDPAHTVLAVTDNDVRRGVSFSKTYLPDGRAVLNFTELTFTDGMAVVALPKGVTRNGVMVADLPFRDFKDFLEIENVELAGEAPQTGPTWGFGGPFLRIPLSDQDAARGPVDDDLDAARSAVHEATRNAYGSGGSGPWAILGRTSYGRSVVVLSNQLDDDPARLLMFLDGKLSDEGVVTPTAVLPVQIHLPDGQGWVVAAYGADLRYRSAGGSWQPAHHDAALLPDAATEVEVAQRGHAPVTVTLSNR